MREILEKLDLVRKLYNLRFALAVYSNTLDSDDATRVEVERSVDGTELTATDTFSDLLCAREMDQFR